MVFSCGCQSEHEGILCEWDTETRECEPAIAYGYICAKCYLQLGARPTEKEQEK
jgi:hypothetical protein